MPRQNQPRSMNVEEFVARRIEVERRSHNWSYETLAKRMAQVGCVIQPSAIQRIEKGDPPRKISVDEAVAMAKVFKLSLEEFLQEGESVDDSRLRKLVSDAEASFHQVEGYRAGLMEAENDFNSAVHDAAKFVTRSGSTEISDRFAHLLADAEAEAATKSGTGYGWELVEVLGTIKDAVAKIRKVG